MANTTFSGPVRSQNGFQVVTINQTTGAVTTGATLTKLLTATAALDFPSISAVSQADLTITVTGAVVGDEVALALPAAPAAGIVFNAFVSRPTQSRFVRRTSRRLRSIRPRRRTAFLCSVLPNG